MLLKAYSKDWNRKHKNTLDSEPVLTYAISGVGEFSERVSYAYYSLLSA